MKNKKSDSKNPEFVVPPQGSLGLLALGYRGLYAWRKAKLKYLQELQKNKADEKKSE